MNRSRILAFIASFGLFFCAVYFYFTYVFLLGFPDGGITDLGRAERALFSIGIWECVIAGMLFLLLGVLGGKQNIRRSVPVLLVLQFLFFLALFLIDYQYLQILDNGIGG